MSLTLSLKLPSRIWEKKYGRNANHVKKGQQDGMKGRQRPGVIPENKLQSTVQDPSRPRSGNMSTSSRREHTKRPSGMARLIFICSQTLH